MEFVVNEWLMEYLRPSAPKEHRQLVEEFLQRFGKRPQDKIFVREPSPFLNKALRYPKEYKNHEDAAKPYQNFIKFILLNPQKCERIDAETIELPDDIIEKLNQTNTNYVSDTYLFEAAMFTEDKIIVTTDEKLVRQMKDINGLTVIMLTDFLDNY